MGFLLELSVAVASSTFFFIVSFVCRPVCGLMDFTRERFNKSEYHKKRNSKKYLSPYTSQLGLGELHWH